MTWETEDGTLVLRCQWLVNPGQVPRPNVRLTVLNGEVAEVCDVPSDEQASIEPLAILPSFVNVHTHLEFSSLTKPLRPSSPFTDWIRSVVGYRRSNVDIDADQAVRTAVQSGLAECQRRNVTAVGDITTSDSGVEELCRATPETTIISFRELLGFTADRIDLQLDIARRHLSVRPATQERPATGAATEGRPATRAAASPRILTGLSPHAPYSVHPAMFEAAVDLARAADVPIAMHLAETQAELELLATQSGEFVDFLASLGLWDSSVLSPGTTPERYLQKLAQAPRALAVHGNCFSSSEIEFLGRHPHVATVYCPRTHRYFGHSAHPWQKLLSAGATVVLGTDSRASNPDLNLWKELQLVAQQTGAPPLWELLPMITTTAAKALGLDARDYEIAVGNRFRATVVHCFGASLAELQRQLLQAETALYDE